jgi:hypothetical protein
MKVCEVIIRAPVPANVLLLLTSFQCTLSKTHAGAATIFVDEFDAGGLERASYNFKSRTARLTYAGFKLMDGDHAHACVAGKFLLGPTK